MLCRDKSKCHSCWSVHWCQAVRATAALRVGVPRTKSDAIRKPEELQCKILDRDNTKEIRPFCIDASKVMRLSYDRCHGRRIHIHSMSRYLADKIIHLQKTPVKKKSLFCVLGGKKKKKIIMKAWADCEVPQYLRRKNYSLSPWRDCGYCLNFSLGTSYPCDTDSWGFFLRVVVVSIGLFKELLGNFLTKIVIGFINFLTEVFTSHHHHHLIFISAQNIQGAIAVKHLSAAVWD